MWEQQSKPSDFGAELGYMLISAQHTLVRIILVWPHSRVRLLVIRNEIAGYPRWKIRNQTARKAMGGGGGGVGGGGGGSMDPLKAGNKVGLHSQSTMWLWASTWSELQLFTRGRSHSVTTFRNMGTFVGEVLVTFNGRLLTDYVVSLIYPIPYMLFSSLC